MTIINHLYTNFFNKLINNIHKIRLESYINLGNKLIQLLES